MIVSPEDFEASFSNINKSTLVIIDRSTQSSGGSRLPFNSVLVLASEL